MKLYIRFFLIFILLFMAGTDRVISEMEEIGSRTSLIRSGRNAFAAGDFTGAAGIYRRAIDLFPSYADAWIGLSWSLFRQGKTKEAEKNFQDVLIIMKFDPKLLDNYIAFAGQADTADGALRFLIENIDAATDPLPVQKRVFYLYCKLGHLNEAREVLDGIRMDLSGQEVLAMQMALAYGYSAQGQYDLSNLILTEVSHKYPFHWNSLDLLKSNFIRLKRYDEALKALDRLLSISPRQVDLLKAKAEILFELQRYTDAAQYFERAAKAVSRPPVYVLLYHGITALNDGRNVTSEEFEDQVRALKESGYNFISIDDLTNFYDGKALPERSVLITFDDGRKDSYINADPVLRKYQARAVMFIPAKETLLQPDPFFCDKEQIQSMIDSAYWDVQAHGYLGGGKVEVNGDGHKGSYFTSRAWLTDENRVETDDEFRQRVMDDHAQFRNAFTVAFPSATIKAFAFPYGDFGQDSYSNTEKAVEVNLDASRQYYKVSFFQDYRGINYAAEDPALTKRYKVKSFTSGEDLVRTLESRREPAEKPVLRLLASLNRAGEHKKGIDYAASILSQQEWPAYVLQEIAFAQSKENEYAVDKFAAVDANAFADYNLRVIRTIRDEWRQQFDTAESSYKAILEQLDRNDIRERYERMLVKREAWMNEFPDFPSIGASQGLNFLAGRYQFFTDSNGRSHHKAVYDAVFPVASKIKGTASYEYARLTDKSIDQAASQNSLLLGMLTRSAEKIGADLTYIYRYLNGGNVHHGFRLGLFYKLSGRDEFRYGLDYDLVPTLQAGLEGITAMRHVVEWEHGDPDRLWFRVYNRYSDLSDGNYRIDNKFQLKKNVNKDLPLFAWLEFGYSDSRFSPREYYSPQSLKQIMIGLSHQKQIASFSYSIRYNIGYGTDKFNDRIIQSGSARLSYKFRKNWETFLAGEYLLTPTYESAQVEVGVKCSF